VRFNVGAASNGHSTPIHEHKIVTPARASARRPEQVLKFNIPNDRLDSK
jgi:hypothetical protein